ncbi:MAG: redoxin domain-containing protein [Thermoplasmatota archaeon]
MRVVLLLLVAGLAGCTQFTDPTPPGFPSEGPWLQSEPLTRSGLEGQVVLVDFWTYSCINCIRTLPHLTAWYDTYAPFGFVIVGVHTPEFDFEKDTANVEAALEKYGINYPVVQDDDRTIWRAWEQRFWPAKYLIAPDGDEVYRHFGEGAYFETETKIRELLEAQGHVLPERVSPPDGSAPRVSLTRELYAGTWRQHDAIGNAEGYRPGQTVTYTLPENPGADRIYLEGDWFNGEEALTAQGPGKVSLWFRAGAANFVAEGPGCVTVLLGGEPVSAWGPDVDDDGQICLDGADSYDFFAGEYGSHRVLFEVPDGFSLYTFAFSRGPATAPQ